LPHQEFLQVIHYNINFQPPDPELVLFDIEMPHCGPRQICNLHMVETVHDNSNTNIRWVLLLSLEPKDRFLRDNVHTAYSNDTFYKRVFWSQTSGIPQRDHTARYPYPIAYPYETMRLGLRQSSVGTGSTWNILIFYTIERIDKDQLTAITVRRGTVKHARGQGPEP